MSFERKDLTFDSENTDCAAWLYLPAEPRPHPVVVMAHGFAGERAWRLPAYAERFADAGIASFLFDYRNFGDSAGEPRNLIAPKRHCEDWANAVEYVRERPEIDSSRLGLWGTSLSGGHVLRTAARSGDISALVCQVPFSDGPRTAMNVMAQGGVKYAYGALSSGVKDVLRLLVGAEPYYIPVVADPGEFALMNTPGAREGVERIIPAGCDWENRCPARIALTFPLYRPIVWAERVEAPVLVQWASQDKLIPANTTRNLVDRLQTVEHECYEMNHFEGYVGDLFRRIVAEQIEFLKKTLR